MYFSDGKIHLNRVGDGVSVTIGEKKLFGQPYTLIRLNTGLDIRVPHSAPYEMEILDEFGNVTMREHVEERVETFPKPL